MSVRTPEELEALRRAGRAVAATLREVSRRVRPGVTTAELDALAARVLARHAARPAHGGATAGGGLVTASPSGRGCAADRC